MARIAVQWCYIIYLCIVVIIIVLGWSLWLNGTVDGKLYDQFRMLQFALVGGLVCLAAAGWFCKE